MHHLAQKAAQNLEAVRQQKPLIHNITNYVVMNYTANALLAMGASPVMAHAPNEVEEMVAFARSLVLNIGTLTDDWVESMIKAGCKASGQNTPIILDPVGSGATALRTYSAQQVIAKTSPAVIRGNASEILSLRDANSKTKGVDSIHSVDDAAEAAQTLATELNTTLAITGPTDLITNGKQIVRVDNGHPLMGYVTGTGCTATVVVGAFSCRSRSSQCNGNRIGLFWSGGRKSRSNRRSTRQLHDRAFGCIVHHFPGRPSKRLPD